MCVWMVILWLSKCFLTIHTNDYINCIQGIIISPDIGVCVCVHSLYIFKNIWHKFVELGYEMNCYELSCLLNAKESLIYIYI